MLSKVVYVGRNHGLKSRVVLKGLLESGCRVALVIVPSSEFNFKKMIFSKKVIFLPIKIISYIKYIHNIFFKEGYLSLSELARSKGIPILYAKDKSLKSYVSEISTSGGNILLSCGWGWRISKEVLNLNGLISINCHSSYLPEYKGSAAYLAALINEENDIGVTVHYISENFDDGEIVFQSKVPIYNNDTPDSLNNRISLAAVDVVKEAIANIESGVPTKKQGKGTYYEYMTLPKYNLIRLENFIRRKAGLTKRKCRPL